MTEVVSERKKIAIAKDNIANFSKNEWKAKFVNYKKEQFKKELEHAETGLRYTNQQLDLVETELRLYTANPKPVSTNVQFEFQLEEEYYMKLFDTRVDTLKQRIDVEKNMKDILAWQVDYLKRKVGEKKDE